MQKPNYGKDRNKELMDYLYEENKSEKLKLCPFCGSEAKIISTGNFSSLRRHFVACFGCGVETPRTARTMEQAAKAWNRRTDNAKV